MWTRWSLLEEANGIKIFLQTGSIKWRFLLSQNKRKKLPRVHFSVNPLQSRYLKTTFWAGKLLLLDFRYLNVWKFYQIRAEQWQFSWLTFFWFSLIVIGDCSFKSQLNVCFLLNMVFLASQFSPNGFLKLRLFTDCSKYSKCCMTVEFNCAYVHYEPTIGIFRT